MTAERVITRLHNNPPSSEEIQAENLAKNYAEELEKYEATLLQEQNLPPEINTDDDQGKYGDYVKKLATSANILESSRKVEVAPHSAIVKTINAFFKSRIEKLEAVKERIDPLIQEYARRKDDERRRALEEKAKAEREEAARKQAEAEKKQKEAEVAVQREREERERIQREKDAAELAAARAAEEARRKADEEAAAIRRKAQEEADRKQAEADKAAAAAAAEIDRLKREADERLSKDLAEKEAHEKALKAAEDARRKAEREQEEAEKENARKLREAEKQAKEALAAAEREIKEDNKALKEELKEKDAELSDLKKETKDATRQADATLDDAARADKSAFRSERKADAKMTDLSRTRGTSSMVSLSEHWTGHLVDLDVLDLQKLRYHIPLEALDTAIKACVRAGHRDIAGASIYLEDRTNVR